MDKDKNKILKVFCNLYKFRREAAETYLQKNELIAVPHAFICLRTINGKRWIDHLYVEFEGRNKGIGTKLVEEAIQSGARRVQCDVSQTSFFERFGFKTAFTYQEHKYCFMGLPGAFEQMSAALILKDHFFLPTPT